MTNNADPDQLASEEANWSGSTLFAKAVHIWVQQLFFLRKYFKMLHCVGTHVKLMQINRYSSFNMSKHTSDTQQRLRWACTSPQIDQSLHCPHEETLHPLLSKMCVSEDSDQPRNYKTVSMLNLAEHEIFSNKYENDFHIYLQRNFHAQLCLTGKDLHLLVIWDLLAGQISCSVELS